MLMVKNYDEQFSIVFEQFEQIVNGEHTAEGKHI